MTRRGRRSEEAFELLEGLRLPCAAASVTFPLVLLTEALQRGVLVGDGVVEARVLGPCELKRESLTALASADAARSRASAAASARAAARPRRWRPPARPAPRRARACHLDLLGLHGDVGERDGEVVRGLAAAILVLHRCPELVAQYPDLLVRAAEYEVLNAPLLRGAACCSVGDIQLGLLERRAAHGRAAD